jgi:cystathionine beta-lyase/cystathionine gamma-synthase
MNPSLHIESICTEARADVPSDSRPSVAPIYQAAVWALDNAEQCEAFYTGEQSGFIYTREANPNHQALEKVIAALEGAEAAVAFGTGMGAIAAALTAFTASGQHVLAAWQLYGTSVRLLSEELPRFGVETDWVDFTDLAAVEIALSRRPAVLLVETISNPLVQIADLPRLAQLCRASGTKLLVDTTFATPLVCRPLEYGADVAIHSLTKFLGGHSDLTLGAAAGNAADVDAMRRSSRIWGAAANPFESWLAVRGITTYPLRIERACGNALELAGHLEGHPRVRRVYYPGLQSHPQHALACEIMPKFGSMLSFDVSGGAAATAVLRNLEYVRFVPSLGDVSTTISYPVATSHRGLAPELLAESGISAGTLRLSVGIDHLEDVWADLRRALDASEA